MSEKEMFINAWEREFKTTLKVLKAYPLEKLELKPHERSRSAKELAWGFVLEEKIFCSGTITGKFDFESMPAPPATLQDIMKDYEKSHTENVARVKGLPEGDFNKTVKFYTGPKQMGDVRRGDLFWTMLMDQVHHRGQFSVYLRMSGGKVPSIYGPSADEPWM